MENQRIRLSKTLLKNALIKLLQIKNIDKITIYELCQTAGINRTTFYKYYGNQFDLLADIENELFETLNDQLSDIENVEPGGMMDVFRIFLIQKDTMRVLINSVPDEEFVDKLFNLPIIVKLLKLRLPEGISESQADYYSTFFFHGGYAMIRKWLNEDQPISPEELSKILSQLPMIYQ